MRYELRTRFELPDEELSADGIGRADRFLEWLDESLSTAATLGVDIAPRQWLGNRYTERVVKFELVTQYRNVFAATADQQRIARVVGSRPAAFNLAGLKTDFEVMRVYGEAEMLNIADPTKKTTHPC